MLNSIVSLLKETISEWSEDKASRLAAALAYYTIFSLAPLLLLVISLAGIFVEPEDIKGEVYNQIETLVGENGVEMVETMLDNVDESRASGFAVAIGLATLIWGATGVFNALHDALNTIWNIEPQDHGGILALLRSRLLSFSLIPTIGFLLLVSLVVDTALSALRSYSGDLPIGTAGLWAIQLLNLAVSLGVITLMFAAIYKILPDAAIAWKDVWVGSFATAVLFLAGRFAIGLYLGHSSTASVFGAAGSLIVILVWIYYSAQLLFLGAEFTQVYARRYGTRITSIYASESPPPELQPAAVQPRTQRARRRAPSAGTPDTTAAGYATTALVAFLAGILLSFWNKDAA